MSFCRTKPWAEPSVIFGMLFPPWESCISTDAESTEPSVFVALSLYETVSVIVTCFEDKPRTSSVLLSSPPTYFSNCKFVSPETLQESVTELPFVALAAEEEKELIDGELFVKATEFSVKAAMK